MADGFILENAHLQMRVDPQGGKVQSLFSRRHQTPVLHENPAGGLFPMVPLANRVAGNRFSFRGREIILPNHQADARFFLHGDGWLSEWEVIERCAERCVLELHSRHSCGFDYRAQIRYELRQGALLASLTVTHCGDEPMLYGGGFHPFFAFDRLSRMQFLASGHWPEGELHLPLSWRGELPEGGDFTQPACGEDRWLNVCYSGWNGTAVIQREVMSVTISSQTPWLMLFRMSGEPFVCLEPQSHPVNAHNVDGQPGLVVLGPEDRVSWSLKIAVK
ncbi:galactose mutarotase-like enzyme [Raoultella sp. BIGb0149]|uniref:aldose 1-epimerase n=1 Tax=Raoultella sp. BIGb0149 TaxID=2485116 RepID=UPI00105C46C7|nr:aldose 1-epimerase [Raoultella sp. BIGb0149]TDQ19968.1 galactose mutarotase-like enzyme [Raoultella sp. BIGb0149]